MRGMIDAAARSAGRTAQRGAAGVAAALLLAVGLGFLTVAAWIVLAAAEGATLAALVIGCAYAGLGVIGFGWLLATRNAAPPAETTAQSQDLSVAAVMEAFLIGMSAGQRSRRRK